MNETILVVDDNEVNIDIINGLLFGYDVVVATDGETAIELANQEKIDLILLDIMMPAMDGYEVCEILKNNPKTQDIPVIFITAKLDENSIEKAYDVGGIDYVTKPFKPKELLARVKTQLHLHHLIEEESKQRELAIASSKAKADFLANMSHEIRTPLNAIIGFIHLLQENEIDELKQNYLNIINSSSQSLIGVIDDILDFSKIESGKLLINKIDFNPYKEFQNIIHIFDATCIEKNINLSIILDNNLPNSINTDLLRVKQVITNLISNSIKFTKADKNIIVDINYTNNLLTVSIKDEGKGIQADKLELIFEAFTQENNSTTREYGGTGLGLSISSKLVKLLGGKLQVKSKLGVGSEFYFSIPVTIGKEIISPNVQNDTTLFAGKKILLVEDNKSNQIFMQVVLKKLNLKFDLAEDGIEAIEAFKNNNYHLILMDENMPNLNGIDATKAIIAIEEERDIKHTPIIALTANALSGDREKFLQAGMDEYLTKPLNKSKLIQTLNQFLD